MKRCIHLNLPIERGAERAKLKKIKNYFLDREHDMKLIVKTCRKRIESIRNSNFQEFRYETYFFQNKLLSYSASRLS